MLVHLSGPTAGAGSRLFLFAPLAGTVFCYGELVKHLGREADLAVVGVQAVGLDGHREPLRRVEAMASCCAEAVAAATPRDQTTLALAGWSFGALVAVETALLLRQARREVALVALLDNLALLPGAEELDSAGAAALLAWDLGRARGVDLSLDRQDMLPLETPARAALIRRRAVAAGISPGAVEDLLRVYEARARALCMYVRKGGHRSCGGRVLALNSRGSSGAHADPTLGWGARITGELVVQQVPGDHHSILEEPHAGTTAAHLLGALGRK